MESRIYFTVKKKRLQEGSNDIKSHKVETLNSYVEQERVVDGQVQVDVAEVAWAVVEVLHAGCADFFEVSWTQCKIIESIRSRVTNIVQEQRIGDTFDTQFPLWREKKHIVTHKYNRLL